MPRNDLLEHLAERFVTAMVAKLNGNFKATSPKGQRGVAKKSAPAFLRNMTCRVEGCRNKSGGPRWGYICEDHRKKLSKPEQRRAREKWNEKHEAVKSA